MNIETIPLVDKEQTAAAMHAVVTNHANDLDGVSVVLNGNTRLLSSMSISEMFDYIRKIPYRFDPKPREIVARPSLLLELQGVGIDCKKKAILMAAFLQRYYPEIPWRFVSTSRRPDKRITHVFVQAFIGDAWINLDCTYFPYYPGQPKVVTNMELLHA